MRIRLSLLAAFCSGLLVAIALPAVAAQFWDVRPQDYFAVAVERLSRLGVIRGYSDGRFGPNDGISRGQIATLMQRYDASVVQQLRDQVEELRRKNGLGTCGDGTRQTGEQCDDRNRTDGDGCSRECLSETSGSATTQLCEGRYQIGQSYPSADGCNTCTCTVNGSACTLRACASSSSRSSQSTSSVSSSAATVSCQVEMNDFKNTAAMYRNCTTDLDCTLFVASCPYLTCGEAIRKDAVSRVEDRADDYFLCKQRTQEPTACAGCTQQRAVCQQGLCTAK